MTKEEIFRIKEHIEIHARREPHAIKITEIMWKAVAELEHLADLEKENAEWKQRNETLKDALEHARKVYGDALEKSYKEIAELKKQQFTLKNERNTFLAQNEQYEKDLIGFNDQLIKAREIIKKIEKIFYSGEIAIKRLSKISDILAEAETFLRDSEVEK